LEAINYCHAGGVISLSGQVSGARAEPMNYRGTSGSTGAAQRREESVTPEGSGNYGPGGESRGMDASITRRGFLSSTLLASGAALMSQRTLAQAADIFTGSGGVEEFAISNTNTSGKMKWYPGWWMGSNAVLRNGRAFNSASSHLSH
jgi:hypothetical protein